MGEPFEGSETFLDLFVIQDSQTVKTKGFYGKRGHDAAKNDRLFELLERAVARRREIAQEAAGERVAGTGRIADIF